MKSIIKTIAIVLVATQFANAQEKHSNESNEWTSARPDGHAPIGVMGDHMHHEGEFMFSYRYMNMNMEGLLNGTSEISNDAGHDAGYMVTPKNMPMQMHMLGMMYAPSDDITLMVMAMYTAQDMDLQMRMASGMTVDFSTASSGFGDVKLGMLYKFINKNRNSLHGQVGISIPTGSLEAMDQTPMSAPNEIQLPYPMQLGSGTFDADLALTYLGQSDVVSWGTQLKGTYRFGENEYDYRLGNQYRLNSWFAYKATDWLSFSLRGEGLVVDQIQGANPNLNPMMVTTADTTNSGGKYVNGSLGFNLSASKGALKGGRFGFEYTLPVYQDVNGIQLEQKGTFTLGLQYAL